MFTYNSSKTAGFPLQVFETPHRRFQKKRNRSNTSTGGRLDRKVRFILGEPHPFLVEIHQVTQTHKKVNKIHLKKDEYIYIKETHQPLWPHFYSDYPLKKGIIDLPYSKHWYKLDNILTRRTILSLIR